MKKVPLYSFTHFSRFISICKKLELMLYYKQCYVSLLFLIDSNCKKMLKFGNIGSQLLMVVKSYFFSYKSMSLSDRNLSKIVFV